MEAELFFRKAITALFEEEKIISFEEKLFLNESRMKKLKGYIEYSIIEGIFAMIFFMTALNYIGFGFEKFFFAGAITFFSPFFINYILQDIIFEKRKRKKEELLPDLLLEASVFCDDNSLLNTIEKLSEIELPLVKKDFERARIEINNGSSIEEALNGIKRINKSVSYSRVIDLLLQGYKSGAKMASLFKETAEDLLEAQAIIRERQAVMLITKYTLLLAAGIIVPSVLGLIIGLVSGLSFESMAELELGLSLETRKEMFSLSVLGTGIYLGEYALISSFFLSLGDGNKKQFWFYAAIIIPIALISFFVAQKM